MKVAVFVTIWALGISPADLKQYHLGEPLAYLKDAPGVEVVEYYSPYPGDLPKMDDVPSPVSIVQIDLASREQAQALVGDSDFQKLFVDSPYFSASAEKVRVEIVQPVQYDIPGHASPPPRTAALSFVVRYYGPVENQAEFVDFYTKNHPPLLAKFPDIRNVICYLPMDYEQAGNIGDDSLVIGNEVVFDNLDALNAALASDAMPALSDDSKNFAKYGYSTHHAMYREAVYSHGQ
ncbi:MAG: hypothetical protein ACJAUG_003582 [Halioglobus sp.]|jgi:uncharacterized protein (TIGR02118 family)